jgi:hypothetical protein
VHRLGRSRRGSVKSTERRRKRKRVFHKPVRPKLNVNSVINVDMITVVRRSARAGLISRRFFLKNFLFNNSTMVKLPSLIFLLL